jgi:hypothetical protein
MDYIVLFDVASKPRPWLWIRVTYKDTDIMRLETANDAAAPATATADRK